MKNHIIQTRRLLALVLIGSVFIAFFTLLIWLVMNPVGPGISKENFDRINRTMTELDVEALLGQPGVGWLDGAPGIGKGCEKLVWPGDQGIIHVLFIDGRVLEKEWREPTLSYRIRLRIRLQLPSIF